MCPDSDNIHHAASVLSLPGAGLHVMIVDDDAFIREILADMLTTLGVNNITHCGNGRDAISSLLVVKPAPDLILCDLHMPGRDGFQLMEELAQKQYQGCIALLSGQQNHILHSGEVMARFHQLPILAALEKPATREQLRDLLARVRGLLKPNAIN